jgi:hypothetical protein
MFFTSFMGFISFAVTEKEAGCCFGHFLDKILSLETIFEWCAGKAKCVLVL